MKDNSNYREPDGDSILADSEVWKKSESETEKFSDDIEWDGTESTLIVEDDIEEYEENPTGVEIKYVLSDEEIFEIFKHTDSYKKNNNLQRKHTIIQGIVFLVLILLWIFMKNTYYAWLTLFPIVCVAVIWVLPFFSIKRLAKEFSTGKEIKTEIYPDKICMEIDGVEREIPLNGEAICEEIAGMIMIHPKNGETAMIPVRAIEPEFLSDVHAMIFAGSQPKYEE